MTRLKRDENQKVLNFPDGKFPEKTFWKTALGTIEAYFQVLPAPESCSKYETIVL